MMERLVAEDDEAYALAQELAERRGTGLGKTVVESLRASLREAGNTRPPQVHAADLRISTLEELIPEQRAL